MERAGFGSIKQVPCIFDETWKYQAEASRYFRERATSESPQSDSGVLFGPKGRDLTKQSLSKYAYQICNFLEWCELRGRDWRKVAYETDILDGYQAEMLQGTWSANNVGLNSSTVNRRIDQACAFLTWAARVGLRPSFFVPTLSKLIRVEPRLTSHGHAGRKVEVRVGTVRESRSRPRMPMDTAVTNWLTGVRIKKGATKALMAELILKTAIRREEAVQWRRDTLPVDSK